jgi:carboxynorspermidine decarboxylase
MRALPELSKLKTPCYLIDEAAIKSNLEVLQKVEQESGARILLAQKAFSMFRLYPLMAKYLQGTTASGVNEAKLGHDLFGGETHIFSPAFDEVTFDEVVSLCGHIVFNSFSQWERFRKKALQAGVSCGMRINPAHSTQEHGIYDPCAEGSRLGVTIEQFRPEMLEGLEGLHFHCLCEQDSDALEETLHAVEEKFGKYLPQMKWVNFGGGHHITRPGYDILRLNRLVKEFSSRYNVTVYLEPGEAVALNAGYLITSVMDVVHNTLPIAILDASAACHMPDVMEMPYRPPLLDAGQPGEMPYTYRLAGPTCLAGDVTGDYSFDRMLATGDKLVFGDMAIYTMVKNNTFNGMNLPDILLWREDGEIEQVRRFGYEDFKMRLS